MKKINIIALLSSAYISLCALNAQTTDTTQTLQSIQLEPVTVSANQAMQQRNEVVQSIQVLTNRRIAFLNPQTSADLMASLGTIHVQRSQQGGGSPVLRGFEASRVLLVVDGVRMNNAIYRSGHLQNIITVDPAMLQRAEVLFGPASTVYGSDALGGAVVFTTRQAQLSETDHPLVKSNAFVRYSTANQEKTAHLDVNIGGQRFASLTSLSFSDFGDLRMGSRAGSVPFWGARKQYIERINGIDSIVTNSDSLIQRQSGYQQWDLLQKFLYRSGRATHQLNVQYSNSSNIPRYDRLTDRTTSGRLRFAEWYYGPQLRAMAQYKLDIEASGFFDYISANVSAQRIFESRHTRSYRNDNRVDRIEDVTVLGYNVDFQRNRGVHWLRMGIDGQSNSLTSTAQRVNIVTGAETPADTRYPDGDNTMHNGAVFVQHRWRIAPRLTLNDGFRLGYTTLRSTFVSRDFFPFPYDEATQNTPVWSGSVGLIYAASKNINLNGMIATGFRVPNIDDLGKIFESGAGTLIVPNPNVKPEKTITYELGINGHWGRQSAWETSLFLTDFRDAIVTAPFTFNGASTINYDGQEAAIFANQNQNRARLMGLQSHLVWNIHPNVVLQSGFSYTHGMVLARDTVDAFPLDHIPPVTGRIGVEYHNALWRVEGFCNLNGSKRLADYSPNGEDNLQYATPNGMPSWYTLNLHAGYKFWSNLHLQIGVDNILDTQYRTFASGIHMPGRNFFVALRWMH
jgi:hemoglobin/transferrin/lactoferrin receptor protein